MNDTLATDIIKQLEIACKLRDKVGVGDIPTYIIIRFGRETLLFGALI
jgi:hypothetical protein